MVNTDTPRKITSHPFVNICSHISHHTYIRSLHHYIMSQYMWTVDILLVDYHLSYIIGGNEIKLAPCAVELQVANY